MVALNATIDKIANFDCWQDYVALKATFINSNSGRQSIASSRWKVALKATVDRNVYSHCWQDFGSSESYDCQLRELTVDWL